MTSRDVLRGTRTVSYRIVISLREGVLESPGLAVFDLRIGFLLGEIARLEEKIHV